MFKSSMEPAIKNNDVSLVTRLLESGERYPLMLHDAVFNNNIEMVRLMVAFGIDVNTVDDYDQTPLMWALEDEYWDIVNLLIDNGANLSIADNEGLRPWDLAITRGTYEFVQKIVPLVDHSTIRSTCLADLDNLNVIELLFEHGADINSTNDKGTILHTGIVNSSLDTVKWGVAHGLSINQQNYEGYTPLYWAVIEGEFDIVRWLLKHGADPNIPNNKGQYPLQFVIRDADKTMTKILLEYGADPDLISDAFQVLFYSNEVREFIATYRCEYRNYDF